MMPSTAGGAHAYAQSKLAQIPFTVELAQRLRGTGVTVNAVPSGLSRRPAELSGQPG